MSDSIRIIYKNVLLKPSARKVEKLLEEALKESGDFGIYGNLEEGLEGLVRDFRVAVTVYRKTLEVDCGPRSGSGHDCQFVVKRSTRRIDPDSVVFGEVIAPPGMGGSEQTERGSDQ